jgi:uncharacterized membrane protein YfcA
MTDPWFWVGLFVLLAYSVEAMTGFGSIVIALSLGALLLPISELLPVLVPLNIVMSGYLAWRCRRDIQRRLLVFRILPLMLIGTLVGYGITPWLDTSILQILFGALILWFSGREIYRLWYGVVATPHPVEVSRALHLGAGVTHGLFASGGPLLVYSLTGIQLNKGQTRATLLSVWFALNSTLTLLYLVDGSLLETSGRIAALIPVVVAGALLGDFLHRRVDELQFRRMVFGLLFLIGLALLLRSV